MHRKSWILIPTPSISASVQITAGKKARLQPRAFDRRKFCYKDVLPHGILGSAHMHPGLLRLLNIFKSLPCFGAINARIDFLAIEKRIAES